MKLLRFNAAQEWLRSRVTLPTGLSSAELALAPDFPAEVRAHAFFSAAVARADVLTALRAEVDGYVAGETDLTSARARLKTLLAREGWPVDDVGWTDTPPAGMDEDAWRAAKRVSNLGSTRRLDLILRTNAEMAQAIGRRQVSEQPTVVERWPYYRYISRMDGAERPEHGALHNTVLPKDDPFWATHTPPWDFGCRCDIEDADEEDAARYGVARAATRDNPDGSQTATVATAAGGTVNVLPSPSGFTFRSDRPFAEPDWDRIPAGPLRDAVRAEFARRRGPGERTAVES